MSDDTDVLAALRERHGSAKRPQRPPVRTAPEDVSDDLVAAVGALSAALETAEVARGHLYAFHRMSGTVDREVQEAVRELRDAGRGDIADAVEEVVVGRDLIDDMWTFQMVEKYDAQYWSALRDSAAAARHAAGLDDHVFEARMKHDEQSGDPTR
ncbi:hypothetical protein [Jatrophihabitans fulvus]